MADPNPTVDELFKAKAVTNEQVSTLLDAVLAGKLDVRAELAEGYVLHLAAAVKANAFATAFQRDKTSMPGARPNAARTAILLARTRKV
ncbi:hypothetical protein [Methylorubrum aminovorans]|uniref:hypothetical protein n=1 Tax=Methylorubrum aminovorans TaxID=269069 RepID=UPI003C2F58D9